MVARRKPRSRRKGPGRAQAPLLPEPRYRRLLRAAFRSASIALAVGVLFASLQFAGVIKITLALMLLALLWIIIVGAVWSSELIWGWRPRHRAFVVAIAALVATAVCGGAGYIEVRSQDKKADPVARADVVLDGPRVVLQKDGGIYFDALVHNQGALTALELKHNQFVAVGRGEIDIADLDRQFGDMRANLESVTTLSGGYEIAPGNKYFWSFTKDMVPQGEMFPTRSELINQRAGYITLYYGTLFQYKDQNTPTDTWYTVEGCYYLFRDVLHLCPAHNRAIPARESLGSPKLP